MWMEPRAGVPHLFHQFPTDMQLCLVFCWDKQAVGTFLLCGFRARKWDGWVQGNRHVYLLIFKQKESQTGRLLPSVLGSVLP